MPLPEVAWENVKRYEGLRWTHDPDDPGGETICGISRYYNPQWEGWGIVDAMKDEEGKFDVSNFSRWEILRDVQEFYADKYERMRLPEFKYSRLAYYTFDTAILFGENQAVRFLQKGLNSLRETKLEEDGILGTLTLMQANGLTSVEADAVVSFMSTYRITHHKNRIYANRVLQKYWTGWLRRALYVV